MNLLQIDSSPLGDASASRQLTKAIAAALQKAQPTARLVYRDLAATPPAHLSGQILAAMGGAPVENDADVQRDVQLGEEILAEFLAADVIVIGAPMYNFSVPSQLKAWLDRIARAGRTFRYTEQGPVGLVTGKRVIIASSRGGIYAGDASLQDGWRHAMDFQEDYLRRVLGFLGISDIEIVRAEGLGLSAASREQSLNAAFARAEEIVAPALA
jgi:FMN-dependent NADH-azoreductase